MDATLALGDCVGSSKPELRVRNFSEQDRSVHVRVSREGEQLLSRSFSVPAKANREEQETVGEVYPRTGAYQIEATIDGGAALSETVEVSSEQPTTHVTVRSGGELAIGRIAP